MKQDAQIVLKKIRNQDLSKLHFVETNCFNQVDEDQYEIERGVEELKRELSIKNKIIKILELVEDYDTFDKNNKFQCDKGANRSAVDIWRIYNYYFRPVSLFTIMRALYELVVVDNDIETLFCHDIKKQVFFLGSDSEFESVFIMNELGVRLAEWRTIGK
jgi:hypothetical protein